MFSRNDFARTRSAAAGLAAGAILTMSASVGGPAFAMPLSYEDAIPEESSLNPVADTPGVRDTLVTEGAHDALPAIIDGAQPESSLRRPSALGSTTAIKGDAAPWHIGSTEDIIRSLAMIDATAATNIELLREIRRLWSSIASTRGRDVVQPQQDSLEDPFRDMIREAVTEIVTSSRTEALLEIAVDTQRVVNALTTNIGQAVGSDTPAPANPDSRPQHPVEGGQPVDAKLDPAAPVFAFIRTIVTDPYTILLGVLIVLAWMARAIIGWAQSRRVRPKPVRGGRNRRRRDAGPGSTDSIGSQSIRQPASPAAITLVSAGAPSPRGVTSPVGGAGRPSRSGRWRRRRSRTPI